MLHDEGMIVLQSVAEDENRYREYVLEMSDGLFGEVCLEVSWGRIGNRLRRMELWFTSWQSALDEAEKRIRTRRRHRYKVVIAEGENWMDHLEHN